MSVILSLRWSWGLISILSIVGGCSVTADTPQANARPSMGVDQKGASPGTNSPSQSPEAPAKGSAMGGAAGASASVGPLSGDMPPKGIGGGQAGASGGGQQIENKPVSFADSNDVEVQLAELHANAAGRWAGLSKEGLNTLAKNSQFQPRVLDMYGSYACALVAAAGPFRLKGDSAPRLDILAWLRYAAGDSYGNATGIQPGAYTKALVQVFGSRAVRAHNAWTLGDIYQTLSTGNYVILDVLNRQDGVSAIGATFSHAVRVLAIDPTEDIAYIENSLEGGVYWNVPLRTLFDAWQGPHSKEDGGFLGPELGAAKRPAVALDRVWRWAVVIEKSAIPKGPIADGEPDPCASAMYGNGDYCGQVLSGGPPHALYTCRTLENGQLFTAGIQTCAADCHVAPPNHRDSCQLYGLAFVVHGTCCRRGASAVPPRG